MADGLREPPQWMPWYGISFPQAIVRFFTKYGTFGGRASRGEFWWATLFLCLVDLACELVGSALGYESGGILSNLWGLATFIPTLAISVRRLHDSNHPGTWLVLIYGLIFLGGGISGLDSLFIRDDTATGTVNLLHTLGLITSLAGLIIALVLFTAASDPKGEQYDEPDGSNELDGADEPDGDEPDGNDAPTAQIFPA